MARTVYHPHPATNLTFSSAPTEQGKVEKKESKEEKRTGPVKISPTLSPKHSPESHIILKAPIQPFIWKWEVPLNARKSKFLTNQDELLKFATASLKSKDIHALESLSKELSIQGASKLFFLIVNNNLGKITKILCDSEILSSPSKANTKIINFFKKHDIEFIINSNNILFKEKSTFGTKTTPLPQPAPLTIIAKDAMSKQKHYNEAMAHLCKAIFSQEDNAAFYNKAIKSFKLFIDRNIKDEDITNQALVYESLERLVDIREWYYCTDSKQLEEYIIKQIKICHDESTYNSLAITYFARFATINCHSLDHLAAHEWAELAYNSYKANPKIFTKENAFSIKYYLALTTSEYDLHKALLLYTEAQELNPHYSMLIVDKVSLYIRMNKLDSALNEAIKITDLELRNLVITNCYARFNKTPPMELPKSFNLSNIDRIETLSQNTNIFDRKLCVEQIAKNEGDIELTLVYYAHLNLLLPRYLYLALELLNICQEDEKWELGGKLLSKMYEQYPILGNHTVLSLKYLEYIFYSANNLNPLALEALTSLNAWETLGPRAKALCENANLLYMAQAISKICTATEENYLTALDYAEKYLLNFFKGSLEDKERFGYFINTLKTESSHSEKTPSSSSSSSSSTSYSLKDWEASEEELAGSAPHPRAIHLYCQMQKAQLLKEKIDKFTTKTCPSWNIKDGTIYSTDIEGVYCVSNKNPLDSRKIYAAIDPKLTRSLTPEKLAIFDKIIKEKGIIYRELGTNGIKFIDKKVIEVKATLDVQLYTTKMYQNQDGEYLIVFDRVDNHTEIAKAVAASKKIEIIKVDSVYTESSIEEKAGSSSSTHTSISSDIRTDTHSKAAQPDESSDDDDIVVSPPLDIMFPPQHYNACCYPSSLGEIYSFGSGGEDY